MQTIRLALRMMMRDLRAGELHLLGVAIIIAVASLTSVGFMGDRVARGLDREANQLLGGDLLLRADHPWDDAFASEALRRGLRSTDTVLFTSMVSTDSSAQLAGVKAVDAGYPLRGSVRIAAGPNRPDAVAARVPARGEIWLDERLFSALGVSVGDRVDLGRLELRVAAMLTFESDRGANFFSLLPRIIFNVADLHDSALIVEGSRATWRLHLAGDTEAVASFERWARSRLGRGESVENIDNARPEVRRALDQAQRFLRIAALLAVILAAVAVGLTARRFMRRHLDACAIMRCLGARQSQVLKIVVGEFALFGVVATVLGCILGWAVQYGLTIILAEAMGAALPPPSLIPVGHGLAIGIVVLLGFVLPQLLRLGRVSTLRVLRREMSPVESRSVVAWGLGGTALLAIIFWIAGDFKLGAVVAGGFTAALGAFSMIAWGILLLLARLKGRGTLRGSGWRYGLASVVRRMGGSVIQVSAIGIGMMSLVLLTLIRADLLDNWRGMSPPNAPNRFVINIQPDQRLPLSEFFEQRGIAAPAILPMIRGRLTAINGREVRAEDYADDRTRHLVEREFNLSYGNALPAGNQIEAGRWHGETSEPQFSVESGLAETFGLKLGDTVQFSVAGRSVAAPITSVRKLDWDSMRVNFFFISAPGMLDSAPSSLITSFHMSPDKGNFTRDLVNQFPNFSVIDVDAVIGQIRAITDKLITVVEFVFGFALAAGFVVLFAALQATHDERGYELAVLRTLGARNRQVRQALIAEFVVLGGAASLLAVLGAAATGWAAARQVFNIAYVPALVPLLLVILFGTAAVAAGGWLGTRKLLERSPLVSLRALQ